ncbi:hypothetical protein EV215_1815 [Hypnocyclicus thermotrophus]|uniref:Uncharacterized protein n=1 Tax=Hypnocyclicus thermotrophus TaxID=1627895 RepID=A0AA46DXX8_9FUSO|nr:MetS family NSS transporter small subunit [Hypnocyclicus thermotrophus]TDT68094.1 hypothetical protein EV215_1815 [Hypnocyclicus thermotrophus]
MSNSSIVMAVFSMIVLWGGFGVCLSIAVKND